MIIGHVHIRHGVQLVVGIQHGGLWILTHTYPAHLVDIQTRSLLAVGSLDVGKASLCKHLRHLLEVVFHHLLVVVVVVHAHLELRNAPLVLQAPI